MATVDAGIEDHVSEGRQGGDRGQEGALTSTGREDPDRHRHASFPAEAALNGATLVKESGLLARQVGDREVLAMATYMEGHVAFMRGEHARASVLAGESVALYRSLGDLSGAGLALTVPACVALVEGDFARVERLLDES